MKKLLLGLLVTIYSHAATLTVTNLLDSGAGSLRDSVTAAASGDTITFSGPLTGNILLASQILLNKNLSITGPSSMAIVVSGNKTNQIFNVARGAIVTLTNLTLQDGYAFGVRNKGGAIENYGTLTVTHSIIKNNTVKTPLFAGYGGGIYSEGPLTVRNSVLSGNLVDTDSPTYHITGAGGGLYTIGQLTVDSSTVSGNKVIVSSTGTYSSNAMGGGILLASSAGGLIVNSTIAGNSVVSKGPHSFSVAGGVYGNASPTAMLDIANSTISGNSVMAETPNSAFGGGLRVGYSTAMPTVSLWNTIVAGNTAPLSKDIYGLIRSKGHNLISDSSNGSGYVVSDILDKPALLGVLKWNLGFTQTMAIGCGSPAIGAGDPLGVKVDQRMATRKALPDIGAFETP